jgi:PDZ domain-containing protein
VGDRLLKVGGVPVATPDQAVAAVQKATAGAPLHLTIERRGKTETVAVTPTSEGGKPHVGVSLGATYHFPFKVSINIDPTIGGPSAGLMMALSVYDTLTPGSLTDGQHVAGTGTIDGNGTVGPIGGIQQKIPGAMHDGAKLFLVPAQNCQDINGADHGGMRLVKVTTFDDALHSVQTWAKDHNATLPTCGTGS